MAKKSLLDLGPIDIEFEYKGRTYSSAVADNLVLRDLSVSEIKQYLNELPARLSYWKALQVTLEREIDEAEEEFDLWFQEQYMDVHDGNPKATEGWKKSKVMLDNADQYRKKKSTLRDLVDINKKVSVLVKGYDNQIWTLREIARLTHAEISSLSSSSLRESGSLADI